MQFRERWGWGFGIVVLAVASAACVRRSGTPRDMLEPTSVGVTTFGLDSAQGRERERVEAAVALEADAERSRLEREERVANRFVERERIARERGQLGLILRAAADGVSRKTHALERTADATRGVSQATVYKALEALESQRAILSSLSDRVDNVEPSEWEAFKNESARVLDAVSEPDDDER